MACVADVVALLPPREVPSGAEEHEVVDREVDPEVDPAVEVQGSSKRRMMRSQDFAEKRSVLI